ncbi:thioredoxin domain-containing protein [Piscinibacter sp.]|uniref:thioredoxin domain-containing protein n=1 Tax=Piscinibacter sp. TaxID=1903157 RepID=UPI002F3F974F
MPNRLAHETSPYLQQHAGNPVDWYAWGDDALAAARAGDRPILLSVGYSACHWCHVMAHECFEDAETAALMNRHFVNIKVDREERPDLDQIYQTAHQLITRRGGGWPLTMFLTPEGKPFFGGTYFPKRTRYNRPGFDDLLARIAALWSAQREQLVAQGDALVGVLADSVPTRAADAGDAGFETTAAQAATGLRDALMASYDAEHGGFGDAPKFPQSSNLDALLRHAVATHDTAARDAVLSTLRHMAEGGLFDQLGGGFCRYSTDAQWLIPHFEKMLYDNGPLLRLYAQAWQLSGEPLFRQVCEETAGWLMREMQASDGGFFSSIDADSEGEEGRFYVWQRDAVAQQLGAAEFAAFAACYGLDGPPNFEGHAWHLHAAKPLAEVATGLGRSEAECAALIASARARLFALRETRVRPGRDDKVLTSWNALAIDGLAFAARVFGEPRWAESARRAADFVRRALWRDHRLLATHKDGRSQLNAYVDDHAFLLGALLELMQGDTLRPSDLQWARELAELLLAQFEDPADGGFFFTSHDHEALVLRPKSGHDGAMPSGNGMAALQLQRLGHLIGEPRYLQAAERAMALFTGEVGRAPHGYATLVDAMAEFVAPPTLVVLTGPSEALGAWRAALAGRYLSGVLCVRLPAHSADPPATLAKPAADHPQAWVCRGPQCLSAIRDIESLLAVVSPDGPQP